MQREPRKWWVVRTSNDDDPNYRDVTLDAPPLSIGAAVAIAALLNEACDPEGPHYWEARAIPRKVGE